MDYNADSSIAYGFERGKQSAILALSASRVEWAVTDSRLNPEQHRQVYTL
jgi:hypothetical protein